MKLLSLCKRLSASTALAMALVVLALPAAKATELRKQNLTQLISSSQSIIAGTVKKVNDGIDPNGVPYTEVTIEIGIVAKGDLKRGEYTFRQFGLLNPHTLPNGHRMLAMTPEGFPQWHEQEYVVAFMYHPAARTGLQTTAGMAQGKMTKVNNTLVNEFGNVGLFDGIKVSRGLLSADESKLIKSSGPVDVQTFIGLVNHIVKGRWIEKGVMK